jgi:hypothetical protein
MTFTLPLTKDNDHLIHQAGGLGYGKEAQHRKRSRKIPEMRSILL